MGMLNSAQDTWDFLTSEVDKYGNRYWFDESGAIHRENGPAVIYVDGAQGWLKHGLRHRIDGPAVIHHDGTVDYWIEGEYLTEKEFNARKKLYAI